MTNYHKFIEFLDERIGNASMNETRLAYETVKSEFTRLYKPASMQIREEADNAGEDIHDLAVLGILTKALREERWEKFEDTLLPRLLGTNNTVLMQKDKGRIIINTPEYGELTLFPKANKVLIHKTAKWIKPGMKWIIQNLL